MAYVLLFTFVAVISCYECVDQASFYGNSFISIPLKEAKDSTDVSFKFRTYLPDALILLVAGTTDYCIIRLDNGRVKLSINLGSGEFEVVSPRNLVLNDFKWHEVLINRREANLSLTIDNKNTVKKHLLGKFFELNIHYGLFVGGHGNYSDIFFGHIENFRGCLADLKYNGLPVLKQARRRQTQSLIKSITWNCAAEFNSAEEQPISFVNDEAFMTIASRPLGTNTKLELDLKTLSNNGILVYNSGVYPRVDAFVLDIWNGKIKLSLKLGNKLIDTISDVNVDDGRWHSVAVQMKTVTINFHVDTWTKTLKLPQPANLDANEILYVGGIEWNKRSRVLPKGMKISESSFKGCLRNVQIDDRPVSLREAKITEGLLSGCVWEFPCTNRPCGSNKTCIQQGLYSYRCECLEESCMETNGTENKVLSRVGHAMDLELLTLEPLEVLEGGSTLITTTNLHMVLDYPKYGIGESGILFHNTQQPEHGNIAIDVWPHEKNTFTLYDICRDKIHYVHDGSESRYDSMVFEMEFSAIDSFTLPSYLQGKFTFALGINVLPVNDPPVLNILATSVLRLARGNKKIIDPSLVEAIDPDNSTEHLVYSVVDPGNGHLEYVNRPGVPIFSFTRPEVEQHHVIFVHHPYASNESYIALKISDGIKTSSVARLRIFAFPQFWRLENNTGLKIVHQTYGLITPFNLSFISNVPDSYYNAKYRIIQGPEFGNIELASNQDTWEKVEAFDGDDILHHRIRYRHILQKPEFDEFQFYTSINVSAHYTFRITFIKCRFLQKSSGVFKFKEKKLEAILDENHLYYQTEPILASSTSILYTVTSVPLYGTLLSSETKYRMRVQDRFTQEDIFSGNIKYELFRRAYSDIQDRLSYTVSAPGCENITGSLLIDYSPINELVAKINVTVQDLQAREGEKENITPSHLNIHGDMFTGLVFNVTEPLKRGYLEVNGSNSIRNGTDYFTLKELRSFQVFYVHDDSESKLDSLRFVALSNEQEDFEYVGLFKINVLLKNDNSPVRAIDKVFHVVTGGKKLVTDKDLKYTDGDIDTLSSDIVYTCRESPNGELYNAKNTSQKLTQFTQADLDAELILFVHEGAEYGKMKLWITDGQFYVNGILEIQASAPFIRTLYHEKVIVRKGGWALISPHHLSVVTNLFATDQQIKYEVIGTPNYGKLTVVNSSQEISSFTQEDINMKRVRFIHKENASSADEINLRIRCQGVISTVQLNIWILPASYWDPLVVKTSHTLVVEESTSAIISRNVLEISQIDVPSSAITYHVSELPQNGYLSILSANKNQEDQFSNIRTFTQELINENRLLYIQSGANETKDSIICNVTNGMVWLRGLVLDITIIPEHLFLESHNLTVKEGDTVTITSKQIIVLTDYYKSRVTDYTILEKPKHGCVKIHKKCSKTNGFTNKELVANIVQYFHDGTENLLDSIVLVTNAGSKRSFPFTLHVNILPVNDQKPHVVNNTGLTMWEGGTSFITKDALAALDLDKPPDILVYHILGYWWGNLTLATNTQVTLNTFTQEQIDQNLIVFHHQSGKEAKFTFNITDGLHVTGEHSFFIKTKPVELNLVQRSRLHVFPLQRKPILPSQLLTTISDLDRTISYQVITPPSLGRLVLNTDDSGISKVTNKFTQADINNSRIFYEHTHPFSDLYATDLFVFNIVAHLANPLTNQKLRIDISVSSGGLDTYVKVQKLKVEEGGIGTISVNLSGVISFLEHHAGLQAPVIHAAATNPKHGRVFFKHSSNVTAFAQSDLELGRIHYQHDHSDTLEDKIGFSLYLLPGYIALCNFSVPVEIIPINDQPFRLVTPAPHFKVVQGENHTIDKSELATEDVDTEPSDLRYDIISGPNEGQLTLGSDGMSINHFSQKDVNDGRLIYVHRGFGLTDAFHLRVWDGKFRPEYTVLNVQVVPVVINVSAGVHLYIQQGSNVVLLTREQFLIETNGNVDKIEHVVRERPKFGTLYVRDAPASRFNHMDLLRGNVMYMQTDMTASNDSFKVFSGITVGNMSFGDELDVSIRVQPLMQIRNFTVYVGKSNRLSLQTLDATPLVKLTNSNPSYLITHFPRYGEVRKIIRSSGERRNVLDSPVKSFTHEEIQSGLIYLVVKDIEVNWHGLEDKLGFILAASIFQPAQGELEILVQSALYNDLYSTPPGPSDPASHEGGMHMASPNMTRDYFLIVSMVVGVIILGVAVIVTIKCRTFETEDLRKAEQCMQPIPLPRPPERMMVTPSHTKENDHEGFVSSIPTTLPHCKVTPLNDVQARYPYGIDDHTDDWSSCDVSDPSCPNRNNIMLRRNQYWV